MTSVFSANHRLTSDRVVRLYPSPFGTLVHARDWYKVGRDWVKVTRDRVVMIAAALLLVTAPTARAEWLTYRGDAARTGYTAEPIAADVTLRWSFDGGKPTPAWPRSGRLPFDWAYHTVASGDWVFFASSTDHSLYRLDVKGGQGGVIFTADGPLRFAPVIWKDRLFLVSDDGWLYCLDFDGRVIYQRRGGPGGAKRLGNEQLISKWPARGAPAIVGDTLVYAAGIWPSDEIFVEAIDCQTGKPVWINDDSGGLYMPQPHGGADAESGVSAQGYLVVSHPQASNAPFPGTIAADDPAGRPRLLVPTGRAVPAAFDWETGKFEYFHLQQYGHKGGFATMAIGPMFFNSGIAFALDGGQAGETLAAGPMAATSQGIVRGDEKQVAAYQWAEREKADRRGRAEKSWGLAPLWTADCNAAAAMIVAGDTVIAGGSGVVTLIDAASGVVRAKHAVDGNAYGLAVSDGRLFVSTDTGRIYAFASPEATPIEPAQHVATQAGVEPWAVDGEDGRRVAAAAEEILARASLHGQGETAQGYCLDFGCGDGRLAYELARRSKLTIYGIDDDAAAIAEGRKKLIAAGLYGWRVTLHHVDDLNATGYPNYFANLIVSRRGLDGELDPNVATGWQSSRRPYGGQAIFGPAGQMRVDARGALEKAGQWTHQYMSAANQLCSTDERIEGPLGMLWYRDIAIDVPQRHGRPPAPLFYDGLLYHEGIDELVCVDAYNGTEVWRYSLPGILKAYDGDELMGASGTGSNYCVGDEGVFVRVDDHALRIDRRTGKLLGKFPAPPQRDGKAGTWGYLALEHGSLFGSLANRDHIVTFRYRATTGDMNQQLTESSTLFALDPQSGELRWRYDAKDSIRHNAIAIGDEQVFLIDRKLANFDRKKETKGVEKEHAVGVLVALDAKTGEEKWRNENQIDGTTLSLAPEYKRLLMSYQPTRFALESEVGGRLTVFSTDRGEMTWTKGVNYSSRPLINDYTIYAQGGAWDLLSGEERPFNFSRSYGCGVLAGSRHMMVYRSATLGYFDLLKNEKTENYGGMRPGCWINALPAGGLVLVPDASAGCACSYLNQSWIALEPVGLRPPSIDPAGGAFADDVEVKLAHDDREAIIRYTIDGSAPTVDSPRYAEPIRLAESARLRVRAFKADGQVSRASSGEFRIDPHLVPLDPAQWRSWDIQAAKVSGAPSKWAIDGGVIRQSSNIFLGSATEASPDVERPGTLFLFDGAENFGDGEIELELRSSDDDGLGFAFRAADAQHHYLWATDSQRKFRIVARKDGDRYEVLAKNGSAYQKGTWQRVKVTLAGKKITVHVDGNEDFVIEDDRFAKGTIALYSWGSDSVEFRNVSIRPAAK